MTNTTTQKASTCMSTTTPFLYAEGVETDALNTCKRCGDDSLMGFEMATAIECIYCNPGWADAHRGTPNLPVQVQPASERATCVLEWMLALEVAHSLAGDAVARLAADYLAGLLVIRKAI